VSLSVVMHIKAPVLLLIIGRKGLVWWIESRNVLERWGLVCVGVWGPAVWSLSDSLSCSAAQQGVMRQHVPHVISSRDGEKRDVW